MATTISGTAGVTFPAGGLGNPAGAVVGTTDTQTLTNKTIQGGATNSGTAVASTSGTAIDFTSIPSWVKRITVIFGDVSTNGTSGIGVQIGTGGTPTSSGYVATSGVIAGSNTCSTANYTYGFGMRTMDGSATEVISGHMVITLLTGNTWISSHYMCSSVSAGTPKIANGAGSVTLAGALNMVRITTSAGTATFDAGSINILYE